MARTLAQKAKHATRMREWRRRHPELSRERAAAYRSVPENHKALALAKYVRYVANRPVYLARMAAYRATHRDQINEQKRAAHAAHALRKFA